MNEILSLQGIARPLAEADDLEAAARQLEASGDYRVLRRLKPRPPTPAPAGQAHKVGVILDLETTGLEAANDEIIELAMVKFRYTADDQITGVSELLQSFNEPAAPIPPEITALTGITPAMVAGHKIEAAAVERFAADAHIVIAHNAGFDRKFAERAWPVFVHKHWACSQTEVDWKRHGFDGAKLGYLLAGAGFFHGAHRALDDCRALLEVLAQPLPATSGTALSALLERARRKTVRVWAENSPFELKDALKRRGYRWSDGSNGGIRSWFIDVDEADRDAELIFLKREIYQRDIDIGCHAMTARDRFSVRTSP